MPLTLDEYVSTYLEKRGLTWPIAPSVDVPRVKPHLTPLKIKAILWTPYGSLVTIPFGELLFRHPDDFVTESALDKTIHEFKMWPSMTRKPGPPGPQMRDLFERAYNEVAMAPSGREKKPEVRSDQIWIEIIKKLLKKDYKIDALNYGALDDFAQKVAYFYHASFQGVALPSELPDTLRIMRDFGILQGRLGDGQCFTPAQIALAFRKVDPDPTLPLLFPPDLDILSYRHKAKKSSETLFQVALAALKARRIEAAETLHIGSHLERDIGPAKRFGMKTALFAGDRASLNASAEQLRDPQFRPDILFTEPKQLVDVVS